MRVYILYIHIIKCFTIIECGATFSPLYIGVLTFPIITYVAKNLQFG